MDYETSSFPAGAEIYISVDVETAGPYPPEYSLLSIGACTIPQPRQTFYIELKPLNDKATPQSLALTGLSLDKLVEQGTEPKEAMKRFASWLAEQHSAGQRPVFVAFNAGFDWMFINTYFHHYLGYNPFGHAALDIKSLYMGVYGVAWWETSMRYVSQRFLNSQPLSHHALKDALDQADIFKQVLEALKTNNLTPSRGKL